MRLKLVSILLILIVMAYAGRSFALSAALGDPGMTYHESISKNLKAQRQSLVSAQRVAEQNIDRLLDLAEEKKGGVTAELHAWRLELLNIQNRIGRLNQAQEKAKMDRLRSLAEFFESNACVERRVTSAGQAVFR